MSFLDQVKYQLVQHGPAIARIPVKWVPFAMQRPVLELALNQLLKESIAEGELDFLNERWVLLQVTDIAGQWRITFREGKLHVNRDSAPNDVCFSGKLNDFLIMMGRQEDPDTLFFQRRLMIEGDTQLGLEVKNLLDNIDYDELPQPIYRLLDAASQWVMQTQLRQANA